MFGTAKPWCTLSVVLCCLPSFVSCLNAYGHAYSRPDDFTLEQYAAIGKRFDIFTVEKDHAAAVYVGPPLPIAVNLLA